jgi:hypothetical protein
MGKFPASLLSIVFQLCLVEALWGDEHIRRVQEELRKRHLFYGDISGELTSSLTTAIARYQAKKGFAYTGRLDSETCASLGIFQAGSQPSRTPFVVADTGEFRGANGEVLPSSQLLRKPIDERGTQFSSGKINAGRGLPDFAGSDVERFRQTGTASKRTAAPSRRLKPRKETNPVALAFQSVDHAVKFLFGDTRKKKKPRNAGSLPRRGKVFGFLEKGQSRLAVYRYSG